MERTREPEIMNDATQVDAYADADFSAPHDHFVELFRKRFPHLHPRGILDLGCGPGDISRRVARAFPACHVSGIDGAPAMIAAGRERNRSAGLADRIEFRTGYLPSDDLPEGPFDAIVSNSLLHHLDAPSALWGTLAHGPYTGSAVFVMDLLRPRDSATVRDLVERYARDEPEILKRDFENSLHAAYRVDEVTEQLADAGLSNLTTEVVSDRHFIVHGITDPLENT
ncbi:MAG: class I SAM-dependent methyltransferase [Candidatus Binatia bacterium]|nr:class I SAM-dependent methyltransferase [Candidatus Binatia bacterium]